jgi:hypothetical protein
LRAVQMAMLLQELLREAQVLKDQLKPQKGPHE